MQLARQVALQLQASRVTAAFNSPVTMHKDQANGGYSKNTYNIKAGAELFSYSDKS